MPKHIIALDKEDIETQPVGLNFGIVMNDLSIVFTPSAMRELIHDYRDHLIAELYRYTDPKLCKLQQDMTNAVKPPIPPTGETANESVLSVIEHQYENRMNFLVEEHKKNNPDTLWNNPSM